MNGLERLFWVFCAASVITGLAFILAPQLCGVKLGEGVAAPAGPACIDFWLNRYQTLAAAAVGLIGLTFAYRQARSAVQQLTATRLDAALRRRAATYLLDDERRKIREHIGLYVRPRATIRTRGDVRSGLIFDEESRSDIIDAVEAGLQMLEEFRILAASSSLSAQLFTRATEFGDSVGELLKARQENCFQFRALNLGLTGRVEDELIEPTPRTLRAADRFRSAERAFEAALDNERADVSNLIGRLEKALI